MPVPVSYLGCDQSAHAARARAHLDGDPDADHRATLGIVATGFASRRTNDDLAICRELDGI